MMMSTAKTLLLCLLITIWSPVPRIEARVRLPPGVVIPALIAFGDSIIDPGNNNHRLTIAQADYLPYGKDFMAGNMPTGRFSNGRIPTDLISEVLGIKGYVPAYLDPNLKPEELLTGVSFASGSAGFDPLTSQVTLAIPLNDQLDLFKEYLERLKSMVGDNQTSFIVANSFFLLVGGSNDIANTYFILPSRRKEYDYNSYTDLMLYVASSFVQELYKLGARRIGVLSAPPIGCVPSQRTIGGGLQRQCATDRNQVAQLFNSKLDKQCTLLKTQLVGAKVVYVDIYHIMTDMIDNPSKYGLQVVDKGCCGTGLIEVSVLCNKLSPLCHDDTKYMFWDSFHPTETGYQIIVNSIVDNTLKEILY